MIRLLTVLLILSASFNIHAQTSIELSDLSQVVLTDSTYFQFVLSNGESVVGQIVKNSPDFFTVQYRNGKSREILKHEIARVFVGTYSDFYLRYTEKQSNVSKEHRDMAGKSHYFLMSSARGLEKGEWELRAVTYAAVVAQYGITKNISAEMGLLPFYLSGYAGVKWSSKLGDKVSVSGTLWGGAVLFTYPSSGWRLSATFGSEDSHVTFGYLTQFGENQSSIVNISAVGRLGQRFALITDNIILTQPDPNDPYDQLESNLTLSLGGRIILKRGSLDLGLYYLVGAGPGEDADQGVRTLPVLPYIGYTWRL